MSAERPQREVAYRIFAAEFDDAEFSYAESDEERAPNYVVTPTGARVNRMFVVGVLTEVEQVSDDVLRARIVDPTGAFVVYAGQYQPDAMAFFERTDPPAFVAVTGKARTFQPEDSDLVYTSIRPESANEVTAETRDRWVVQTAEQTIDRVETFAGALDLSERGDALADALARRDVQPGLAAGIPKAIDYYETTTGYLAEIRRIAVDSTKVVANTLDEVEGPSLAPDEGDDVALDFEYALPEPNYEPGPASGADEPTERDSEAESETSDSESESEADADAAERVEASGDEDEAESGPTEAAAEPTETASEKDEGESDTTEADSEPNEPESEPTEAPATDPATDSPDDSEGEASAEGDDLDAAEETDPDEMYELSEEERQEVEEEYGVGFETGNEVQEPGEADMDSPDPAAAEDESATAENGQAREDTADESDGQASDETQADATDVDLEDVVVETMTELDDGDGASREDLVATVTDEYDVSADDVEEAIQDALMGGRCYESGDDRITPI